MEHVRPGSDYQATVFYSTWWYSQTSCEALGLARQQGQNQCGQWMQPEQWRARIKLHQSKILDKGMST